MFLKISLKTERPDKYFTLTSREVHGNIQLWPNSYFDAWPFCT